MAEGWRGMKAATGAKAELLVSLGRTCNRTISSIGRCCFVCCDQHDDLVARRVDEDVAALVVVTVVVELKRLPADGQHVMITERDRGNGPTRVGPLPQERGGFILRDDDRVLRKETRRADVTKIVLYAPSLSQ